MYISKVAKVGIATFSLGSLAVGGYVTQNLLIQKESEGKDEIPKDKNPTLIKTEYIYKEGFGDHFERICTVTKKYQEKDEKLSKEDCQKLMKKYWAKYKGKNPDIWLRTDIESFQQELDKTPNLKDEKINKIELNFQWQVENLVECTSQLEEGNNKVVVSCNYLQKIKDFGLTQLKSKE